MPRLQYIHRSFASTEKILSFGVPQGSVLGPKKYCMFSKPIGQMCKRHNMSNHCYGLVYNISIEADTTVDKILRALLCCKNYQFSLVLIKLKNV
jgi:hypothetical protein